MDPHEHLRPESEPYHQILERAAQDWDLVSSRTHLLRNGLNHVYAAQTRDGQELVIRVTDGAHRNRIQIESELTWLAHLARHDCPVPKPVLASNGLLLETFEHQGKGYHVALFERLGGKPLGPDPTIWHSPKFQTDFGRLLGKVHRASESLQLPSHLERGQWYEETGIMMPSDPAPIYEPRTAEQMYLHQEKMRALSAQANPRHYGLCHRDASGPNILKDGDQLWLLDFELGCYMWRVVDFMVSLLVFHTLPVWKLPGAGPVESRRFMQNALAGYREEHEFDSEQLEMLPAVMAIRETLVYIVVKPEPDKWDVAFAPAQATWRETLAFIESRWQQGPPTYDFDLKGL